MIGTPRYRGWQRRGRGAFCELACLILLATACAKAPSHNVSGRNTMDYLTAITKTNPLAVHFSLYNPEDAPGPAFVPVMLEPTGAFVTVVVRDVSGAVVFQTHRPKFTPKLKPDRDESYLAIEPGYSYGVLLELEDCELEPGTYTVEITYSNGEYRGSGSRPVGALSFSTALPLTVE